MVKIIASHAAGYRLAWIVAVLLVPILFFGYYITHVLDAELTTVKSETVGAAFLSLVVPVMLNAAEGKADAAANAKLLADGPRLAGELNLTPEFNNLIVSVSFPSIDSRSVLREAKELALRAGANSKIINEVNPETLRLAVVGANELPDVIWNFKSLQQVSLLASNKTESDTKATAAVFLAVGRLAASAERVHSILQTAQLEAHQDFDYKPTLLASDHSVKDVQVLTDNAARNLNQSKYMAIAMSIEVSDMAEHWLSDYHLVWDNLDKRLSVLMENRLNSILNKIKLVLGLSLVTVLVGVGSAILMFKSTLKQLDQVETARLEADEARYQAENMAHELSAINNEMVRVNSDLGTNMQMLKDAQDALVRKGQMEQMGQLTATIAHELRNPLGAVRTSAFLIERKIKGKELGIEPQMLRINNGITRCDDIITQLLDFSRSKQLTCRLGDLDQWLEKIVAEEAQRLPTVVSINCMLGLNGRNVPFDPSRLQRAIINLVSNASEAMVGSGEDPSRFATAVPIIAINTEIDGDFAVISVSDNGPGISTENLKKIRKPLFTTKSFGTGLGLPAVDQIVNQHGGSLEIQSEPGSGAKFMIRLPLNSPLEDAA